MTTKFIAGSNNELLVKKQGIPTQHPVLRAVSILFSYIFHPVFVPVYIVAFLLYMEPFLFIGFTARQKLLILIQAMLMYTFFPLVSIFLMKALNFISSVKLKDRKDRIIPFIACNIWYFWIWHVWRNLPQMPREAVVFAMSIFLASSIGLLANIYLKISMHGIALGIAVAFLTGLSFTYGIGLSLYVSIAAIISGMVCTARLILNDHQPVEIYWGFAVGLAAVTIASVVI